MYTLHTELDRLAAAERHIAESERRISTQEHLIEAMAARGEDTAEAVQLLRILRELHDQFHIHRRVVLERIEQMRANS